MQIQVAITECKLGHLLLAKSEQGVCAVMLGDEPSALFDELQQNMPEAELIRNNDALKEQLPQVLAMLTGDVREIKFPLDYTGTAFQHRVWQEMSAIPFGATMSYSALAANIGAPRAVRAVASACGANSLAIILPCHRVVGKDGALSGYRWGIERKKYLLEMEAAASVGKIL